jgi:threonine/homoserine/homoserine lactone efflux protein
VLVSVCAFALAAAIIVLLPGPDTLVVVRSIVRGGRSRGVATAVGNLAGLAIWVAAAALGLSALLRASRVGYDVLRFAGAAYLLWLGIAAWRARRQESTSVATTPRGLLGTGFRAGLVTNLLNPKVGVFFVTFLPGFVPLHHSVPVTSLLFGAIFIAETALYWVVLLAVAVRVTRWMSTPRIRRRIDAAAGAVLIGFGIRLALEP